LPAKLRLRCVRCTPSQPRAARQLLQSCGVPARRFANKFAPTGRAKPVGEACTRSCDCGVSDAPRRSLALLGSSYSHAVCQSGVSRTSSLLQVGRNPLARLARKAAIAVCQMHPIAASRCLAAPTVMRCARAAFREQVRSYRSAKPVGGLPAKLTLGCVRCTPSQPRAARQLLQSCGVPERRVANKFAPTGRAKPVGEACTRSCDCGVSDAPHRSLVLLGISCSHAVCQRAVSRTSSLLQAGRNPLERGLPAKLTPRCV